MYLVLDSTTGRLGALKQARIADDADARERIAALRSEVYTP